MKRIISSDHRRRKENRSQGRMDSGSITELRLQPCFSCHMDSGDTLHRLKIVRHREFQHTARKMHKVFTNNSAVQPDADCEHGCKIHAFRVSVA